MYAASLFSLAVPFATQSGLFVSPDEHAVWTFAERIATTGVAHVSEVRNDALNGLLFPRSAVSMGGVIVPAGFLGMPYLVGALYAISPLFAASAGPLFSVLGLAALFFIIKKMGGTKEYALLSVAALALHPAWWYYSIRSLMPNVPFVALLLCAVWLAVSIKDIHAPRRWIRAALSGAFVACALFIRASEWTWLAGLFIAAACVAPLRAYKKELAVGLFGFVFFAMGAFALHDLVYGNPLMTGYTVHIPAWEVGGAAAGSDVAWYKKFFALLFPFGIHEKATLRNAWNYLVVVYPWMTSMAAIGGALLIPRFRNALRKKNIQERRTHIAAFIIALLSAAYLGVLYGSWTFYDNPDPNVVSLGNSHIRYWLPFVVLSAPLLAHALLVAQAHFLTWAQSDRSRLLVKAFPVAALLLLGTMSAYEVFLADDGVVDTRAALQTFAEKRKRILGETPEDAIIIVDRADKYLWPERAVVVPLRSEKTYANIPSLLDIAPLYYFSISLPDEDLAYLQDVTLAGTGIIFTPVLTINEETLYVVHR